MYQEFLTAAIPVYLPSLPVSLDRTL